MKTGAVNAVAAYLLVRSLPRRNENKLVLQRHAQRLFVSEAYLEGMKT